MAGSAGDRTLQAQKEVTFKKRYTPLNPNEIKAALKAERKALMNSLFGQ